MNTIKRNTNITAPNKKANTSKLPQESSLKSFRSVFKLKEKEKIVLLEVSMVTQRKYIL